MTNELRQNELHFVHSIQSTMDATVLVLNGDNRPVLCYSLDIHAVSRHKFYFTDTGIITVVSQATSR